MTAPAERVPRHEEGVIERGAGARGAMVFAGAYSATDGEE